MKFRKHPHLIEFNAVIFLRRLSEKHGKKLTLAAISQKDWAAVADQGFDFVWLMGVWQRSPGARRCALEESHLLKDYQEALPGWQPEDVLGSPYAVYAYKLDPYLGHENDLPKLKANLTKAGLGLILDYVPNHLSLDHPWTLEHPEYFVQGTWKDFKDSPELFFETKQKQYLAHGRDPYFLPWKDTVQIDYFSPAARQMAVNELLKIASVADGVRCDMAMLGLTPVFEKTWGKFVKETKPAKEFWAEVIEKVKAQHPEFIFIAEAYWDLEWDLQQLGFQFTYDKKLYDRLLRSSPEEVRGHLQADRNYQDKSVRFIENHDELRSVKAFGREKSCAAAAVAATVPGLRFFHDGQMEGKKVKLPVQLGCEPKETPDPAVQNVYLRLLQYAGQTALHEGCWEMRNLKEAWKANDSYRNLLSWSWLHKDELRLTVINYSSARSQGRVDLPVDWPKEGRVDFIDRFSGNVFPRDLKEITGAGLYIDLEPWKAHLFEIKL